MSQNLFKYLLLSLFIYVFLCFPSKADQLNPLPDSLEIITYHDLYKMGDSEISELTTELNKKLMLNGDNVKLNLLRAKIFLFQGKYKIAEGLLKRLNKIFPSNAEVNYFLSRLYTQMDSLTLAYSHMYRIDASQNYDESFIIELENDALPFLNRFEKEIYDTISNKVQYILLNWLKKDPFPASIENEYFYKMINRIDYAYENYFDGFALDDRGRIYLKYGKPDLRREFAHTGYRTECWIYRNISDKEVTYDFIRSFKVPKWTEIRFKSDIPGDSFISNKFSGEFDDSEPSRTFFEDRAMLSNKYQETFAHLQSLAIDAAIGSGQSSTPIEEEEYFITTYFAKDTKSKTALPEIVASTQVPVVPLSIDYARFKNDSNSVNLETYIGMPIREIKNAVDGFLYKRIVFNEKLSIKNKNYFPIANHSDKIEFTFDNVETAHFIDLLTFIVPEENFVISFEVDDEDKRFIASKVVEVENMDFLQDGLFLSDLQLSIGIKENVGAGKFTKNGLFVQPYPYNMFSKNAPVFIYFEIYNLVKKHSLTDYDISYGLAKSYEKNILEQIFSLDFSDNPGSIQFNQNYNGNSDEDFIFFQLNVSDLDIGEYLLRVKVTDKNSGKSFIRERRFFLTI